MKSSKVKIFIYGLLIVFCTFIGTTAFYMYLFRTNTSDIVNTLKMFYALQIIKVRYVDDVSGEALISGAVKGMVDSLNDPNSTYLDPKMYKELMIDTEGAFDGVGIILGAKDDSLIVIAPIEGTPSHKAGIESGDRILKIDGQETKNMSLTEAVGKIRGREGTPVVLTIKRENQNEKDYTINRSSIKIKTVKGQMLEDNIGYIRISMFNKNTSEEFSEKLKELKSQGLKAVVLDLRNNPGGLLDESVKVASNFVPEGPIVSVITKDGEKVVHSSHLKEAGLPLVILVNQGSASASEIVAGSVQDTNSGTILGTKTYGKGSVQTVLKLDSNDAIKLTIAKYYTPSGRTIDKVGIEPDVVVEDPFLNKNVASMYSILEMEDVQLKKAIEVIKQKI